MSSTQVKSGRITLDTSSVLHDLNRRCNSNPLGLVEGNNLTGSNVTRVPICINDAYGGLNGLCLTEGASCIISVSISRRATGKEKWVENILLEVKVQRLLDFQLLETQSRYWICRCFNVCPTHMLFCVKRKTTTRHSGTFKALLATLPQTWVWNQCSEQGDSWQSGWVVTSLRVPQDTGGSPLEVSEKDNHTVGLTYLNSPFFGLHPVCEDTISFALGIWVDVWEGVRYASLANNFTFRKFRGAGK